MPSIHASCVLVGARAVLVRGASGSGKSRLVHDLIEAGWRGEVSFTRLVADDRTLVEAINGRLLARPAPALAGLLELRHIGIRELPYEPAALVGLVVDLDSEAERLPKAPNEVTEIDGICLPLLTVPGGNSAFSLILAKLATSSMAALPRDLLAEK